MLKRLLLLGALALAGCGHDVACRTITSACSWECGLEGPVGSYEVISCDDEVSVARAIEAGLPASLCATPSAWSCRVSY